MSNDVRRDPEQVTAVCAKTNSATAQLATTLKQLVPHQPQLRLMLVLAPTRERLPNAHNEDIALHTLAMDPPKDRIVKVPADLWQNTDDGESDASTSAGRKRNAEAPEGTETAKKMVAVAAQELVEERRKLEALFLPDQLRSGSSIEVMQGRKRMAAAAKRAHRIKTILESDVINWYRPNVIVSTLSNLHDNRIKGLHPTRSEIEFIKLKVYPRLKRVLSK